MVAEKVAWEQIIERASKITLHHLEAWRLEESSPTWPFGARSKRELEGPLRVLVFRFLAVVLPGVFCSCRWLQLALDALMQIDINILRSPTDLNETTLPALTIAAARAVLKADNCTNDFAVNGVITQYMLDVWRKFVQSWPSRDLMVDVTAVDVHKMELCLLNTYSSLTPTATWLEAFQERFSVLDGMSGVLPPSIQQCFWKQCLCYAALIAAGQSASSSLTPRLQAMGAVSLCLECAGLATGTAQASVAALLASVGASSAEELAAAHRPSVRAIQRVPHGVAVRLLHALAAQP